MTNDWKNLRLLRDLGENRRPIEKTWEKYIPIHKEKTRDEPDDMQKALKVETLEDEFWEDIIDRNAEEEVRKICQVALDRAWAWDDVRGGYLDGIKVAEARREGVGYMLAKRIWHEMDEEECWRKTGRAPVTVRWVDTNKGSL